MKKKYLYIAGTVVSMLSTACNEDPFSDGGEGNIILTTSVNSDMQVVTRADNDSLYESLMVWVSNDKGLVRRYNPGEDIPERINLVSGYYVAEAWAGDSVPASFDKIWFKGIQSFEVTKGQTTNVDLVCKIANVGVSVRYDENVPLVLSNPIMVVGHKGGFLTFAGEDADKRGYFMMPSYDQDLTYKLTGTQMDGSEFSYEGTILNARPGVEYIMTVTCEEKTNDVGGAIFTIKIDENEIEMTHTVELIAPPKIQGYDFDINGNIISEKGQVGRRCVYVSSATKLAEVVIGSEIFTDFEILNGNRDFNLLGMTGDIKNGLEKKGITFKEDYNEEKDQTLLQINFEAELLNSLEDGDYTIDVKAVDKYNKTSVATVSIIISNAPVVTEEVVSTNIGYTSVILRGSVAKDDVDKIGFNYRKVGDNVWNYIDAEVANTRAFEKGSVFIAELTGLKSATKYEYVAVSGDYVSQTICTFETLTHQQLPNAGFEEWSLYNNKVQIPGLNYSTTAWDSGNHGATLIGSANDNITTPNSDYKHSGNYSACLKSKYVMVKLAAGNIFLGKFLGRVNVSDGATGFGIPFTDKPKSMKLWVKYVPGSSKYRKSKTSYLTDGHDEGQIFVALTDATTDTFNGEQWPFVVNTGTSKYFSKDDPRVIAYGEEIFTKATEGEGLVQIEIPINYYRDDTPVNIIFVASSSRYGDFFEGYDDSVMYLDDIELIYED